MPPIKKSGRRKKSIKSSSKPAVTPVDHELPKSQVETDAVSAKESEILGQVSVSNPDEINVDSAVSSESLIKEEPVLKNCEDADDDDDKQEVAINNDDKQGVGDDEIMDDQKEDLLVDEEKQEAEDKVVVSIDSSQLETVAEPTSAQEETDAVKVDEIEIINDNNTPLITNDATALVVEDDGNGDKKGNAGIGSTQESVQDFSIEPHCENNSDLAVDDDASDDDIENPSESVQDPLNNSKKEKNIEIFVGKLDKDTVEEDLVNVFQQFGELESTRIVRNSAKNKSKCFAFIRFASIDQANRALSELKDGVEVRGKHVKISAGQNNDTLYLGNICKTWKKEEVLEQLKHYGIEDIKVIRLPEDPRIEGKIKGFAFLEFSSHVDAVSAFQRLRKPDAVFGGVLSAKVGFAQPPMDEDLSQVKQVYLEGLTNTWNETKLKEVCEKYGEITRTKRCLGTRNKPKDFGFVTFTSHESALACVEGINNTDVGEVKIKASIAKPRNNFQLQNLVCRGGFKVEKKVEASTSNNEDGTKSLKMKSVLKTKKNKKTSPKLKIKPNVANPQQKESPKKQNSAGKVEVEKMQSKPSPLKKDGESSKEAEISNKKGDLKGKRKRNEQNLKALNDSRHVDNKGTPKKPKFGNEGQNSKIASKSISQKRKKASNYEDRGNKNTHHKKPLKKQKGNMHGRERDNFRNPISDSHYRNPPRYTDQYAPKYNSYHMEMEPHAGYIEPVSAKQSQSRSYSGYVHQPVARQHQTVYLEPGGGSQSQSQHHSRYLERSSALTQSHRGYMETQPYRGYHHQPAIVQIAHDPYDSRFARAVRHDGRGSGVVGYVGGSSRPATQVENHTSYYQVGGAGTSYGGAYGNRRLYY